MAWHADAPLRPEPGVAGARLRLAARHDHKFAVKRRCRSRCSVSGTPGRSPARPFPGRRRHQVLKVDKHRFISACQGARI
eukprot:4971328-Prymnesium_polylepis.2